VDLKILSVPLILLTALVLIIYISLSQIANELSDVRSMELTHLQQLANTTIATELDARFSKVDDLSKTAALEQLVLSRDINVISESLGLWKKLFELSIFAFFDPETNTLYLPSTLSKPGESFGLSEWLIGQLSFPDQQHRNTIASFKGQTSWLHSSAISIAGETRGLFVSGVKLDQSLVAKVSNLIGYPVVLKQKGGGTISSLPSSTPLPKHKLSFKLPPTLTEAGYQLDMYYDSLAPYRKAAAWPLWGLILALLAVVSSLFWIWLLVSKEQRQWQQLVLAAKSPKALKLIPVSGLPKQLADNLAVHTESSHQLLVSSQNQQAKLEYDIQVLTKNLERARDERGRLQQAPKIKSGFLSRMGDEITSPLKSVASMLKLLSESKLADEPKEVVEIARRSHQLLASNIDNVLDLSKLDANMLKLFPADFDIKVLITELYTDLLPHAESKNLKLEWNINERVPASCHGDRQRIHQVLYNLVGNAIRFTKEGSVGIYVDMLYEKGRQYIRFTVIDTGIGIPKSAQNSVFESFETHSKLTTSSFAGRLRLIVSKKLTQLMGGEIGIVSEVGKGSRFWFTIRYQNPRGR
jgi:signal transduction histidine kinase